MMPPARPVRPKWMCACVTGAEPAVPKLVVEPVRAHADRNEPVPGRGEGHRRFLIAVQLRLAAPTVVVVHHGSRGCHSDEERAGEGRNEQSLFMPFSFRSLTQAGKVLASLITKV